MTTSSLLFVVIFVIVLAAVFVIAGVIVGVVFIVRAKKRKRLPAQASTSDIAMGIRLHAYEFNGLYEALYQSMMNTQFISNDAYFEWCDRVELLADNDFRTLFREQFGKDFADDPNVRRARFSLLMRYIYDAGLSRRGEIGERVVVNSQNASWYLDKAGNRPALGTQGSVIKAAWLLDENVVEQGMLM